MAYLTGPKGTHPSPVCSLILITWGKYLIPKHSPLPLNLFSRHQHWGKRLISKRSLNVRFPSRYFLVDSSSSSSLVGNLPLYPRRPLSVGKTSSAFRGTYTLSLRHLYSWRHSSFSLACDDIFPRGYSFGQGDLRYTPSFHRLLHRILTPCREFYPSYHTIEDIRDTRFSSRRLLLGEIAGFLHTFVTSFPQVYCLEDIRDIRFPSTVFVLGKQPLSFFHAPSPT